MNKYTRILSLSIFLIALLLLTPSLSSNQVFAANTTQNRQATAMWPSVAGANKYDVYYKVKSVNSYQHAVGNLPAGLTKITIGALWSGTSYVYNVSALNGDGKEFWWSGEKPL